MARVSEVGPLEVSKQLISLMTKKNVRFLMQKCGVSGSQMLREKDVISQNIPNTTEMKQ